MKYLIMYKYRIKRDRRYQHVINILQIKIEGYKQKHVAKTNQRQNNIQLAKHEDLKMNITDRTW